MSKCTSRRRASSADNMVDPVALFARMGVHIAATTAFVSRQPPTNLTASLAMHRAPRLSTRASASVRSTLWRWRGHLPVLLPGMLGKPVLYLLDLRPFVGTFWKPMDLTGPWKSLPRAGGEVHMRLRHQGAMLWVRLPRSTSVKCQSDHFWRRCHKKRICCQPQPGRCCNRASLGRDGPQSSQTVAHCPSHMDLSLIHL